VHRGLYESLLTTSLSDRLQAVKELTIEIGTVDQADQPHVLARHVARELERELASIRDEHRRLELVAAVLDAIPAGGAEPVPPARQLLAIEEPSGPGKTGGRVPRPRTPLSDAALLTNAHGEPNLGNRSKRSSAPRTRSTSSAHS